MMKRVICWRSYHVGGVAFMLILALGLALVLPREIGPWVGSFLILSACLTLVTGIWIRQSNGLRRLGRVEDDLRTHHKRASEWDWRLREQIRTGVQPNLTAPGSSRVSSGQIAPADVERLLKTGIFSSQYYQDVSGREFSNDRHAAKDYLGHGCRRLIDPSPLIDLRAASEATRSRIASGDTDTLINYLNLRCADDEYPCSIINYPALKTWAEQVHLEDGVSPLSLLLADAGIGLQGVTYGHASWKTEVIASCRNLEALARQINHQRWLRRPRQSAQWDEVAERVWKAGLRRVTQGATHHPLISVIMPVKDRQHLLPKAISSVREQTYATWELLVVDDGSSDASITVAELAAQEDRRIRVLSSKGHGASAARNTGIAAAVGDYIAFLDSDNRWVPDFLELMLTGLLSAEADWAYCGLAVVDDHGKVVGYRGIEGGIEELLVQNHIDINIVLIPAVMLGRVGGFDEGLPRWVDHDLMIRLAKESAPAYFPIIGCLYDNGESSADRITVKESTHWQWKVLQRGMIDWERARGRERVPGRFSVIIPTYRDVEMTRAAVDSLLASNADEDVEIIVVDNGCSPDEGMQLGKLYAGPGRVRVVRLVKNYNFAIGCNIGATESTGEYMFFLNNDTVWRRGRLSSLRQMMLDGNYAGVQPLLSYPDETIQTAGTVWPVRGTLPVHALTGMSQCDARASEGYEFHAITGAAMLLRAEDFLSHEGFDPIFVNGMEDVDFCLRLSAATGRLFGVYPQTVLWHFESRTPGRGAEIAENREFFMERWRLELTFDDRRLYERRGINVASVGTCETGMRVLAPRPFLAPAPERSWCRWAIRTAAIPGARGDVWGDVFFGEALARALENHGEQAVIYRHDSGFGEIESVDDVSLVIRGLDYVSPRPGKTNVLWVISHPELVTISELRSYDLVFAASPSWASWATAQSGRLVSTLLQATEFTPPPPSEQSAADLLDRLLFVGGAHRGRRRKMIDWALESGLPIDIIGPGWEEYDREAGRHVLAESVANRELPGLYSAYRFVVAEHWDQMAKEGFIQNRVFDALACGANVLTDEVHGMDSLAALGGLHVCRSREDLEAAFSDGPREDRVTRARRAAKVVELHSFASRVDELMAAVAQVREAS